ncbi:MAG: isocitrate/isopropylmalate dehydrogenase family protein [bacterium]|nr:isocitrate/isopropylmalate dehydrogenase family protein [bacterium]
MPHVVTLIAGDGIGNEVTDACVRIINAAGVDIEWDRQLAGLKAVEVLGVSLPESTLDSIRKNRVALKGPTTTPISAGHKSANVMIRRELDLYASVRPVKSVAGVKSRYDDVDLLIVRENTEGLYSGLEEVISPEKVICLKVVTKKASERIAHTAFQLARKYNRKLVTVAHKANILKKGDGLFLNTAMQVAQSYPEIKVNDVIIDAMCMKLVTDPTQFEVMLMQNLYGDIVSDLCAGLVGGLGLVPGANLGYDNLAVFEAVHGSAPDIAGKNCANPLAMLKSAIMMLEHLGESVAARKIAQAIDQVLQNTSIRTVDLGGRASTSEFTDALIAEIS